MPANKSIKYVNIYTPAEDCVECYTKKNEGRKFVNTRGDIYFVCTPCLKNMKLLADGVE